METMANIGKFERNYWVSIFFGKDKGKVYHRVLIGACFEESWGL